MVVLPGMLKFTAVPVLSPIGFHGMTIKVNDLDKELTSRSYIVPGFGDAGDLAYGSKQ